MSDFIKYSIVVPFYNEQAKLPKVINALVEIDWPQDNYEIILVDNMSSDDSVEVAKKRLSGFINSKVLSCADYRSSYAARNVGWKNARGQYIVFIDADCIADNALLKGYEKIIAADFADEIGIFAGSIEPYSRINLTDVERYSADKNMLNQDSAVKGWAYRPFAQTANAAFPRTVLKMIDGFNPRLTSGGDGELCWRIMDKTGKRLEYCKDARVFHWHRESIRDLFAQFEKYGVGRFQQSGVVPNFDKGLVGISKDVILDHFEKLEKEIISKTSEQSQTTLLWSLYDIVSKVGNSIGYLGAKSLMATSLKDKDIFSRPIFAYRCSICETPNFNKTPTFSARVSTGTSDSICETCGSSLESRLLHNSYKKIATSDFNFELIPFSTKLIAEVNPVEQRTDKIFTVRDPENISQRIIAIRWALETSRPLLILYKIAAPEGVVVTTNSETGFNIASCQHGYFFDNYTGAFFLFETVNFTQLNISYES